MLANFLSSITMLGLISVGTTVAQEAPQFEVASIRIAPPPEQGRGMSVWCRGGPLGTEDPSLYRCENLNADSLIYTAFDLKSYQFQQSDLMRDLRLNISIKVPDGTNKEQFRLMMQALLKERFKFAWHWEKKEINGYDLLLAKGAPKFKESKPQPGDKDDAPMGEIQKDPEGYPVLSANKSMMAVVQGGYSTQRWANEPVSALAQMLEFRLGGPVQDATGLTGKYDMTLRWIMDNGRVAEDLHGPTLLQAMQDQLGLKVQKKKTTIDVLVVDHMDKAPTEN